MCGSLLILGSAGELAEDRQRVDGVPPLAARGELAADHRVGFRARQRDQSLTQIAIHPMIVAQQADRPPPHAGDRVIESRSSAVRSSSPPLT